MAEVSAALGHRVVMFMRLYDRLRDEPYPKDTVIEWSMSVGRDGAKTDINTDPTEWKSYLVLFRQLISPRDSLYLAPLRRDLGPCIKHHELRRRLACARRAWLDAHKPSFPAVLTLGEYGYPKKMNRLYLYGGLFHSDPKMSEVWARLDPGTQKTIEWAFRNYEGKVRQVVVNLRSIVNESGEKGVLDVPGLTHRAGRIDAGPDDSPVRA